MKVKYYAKVHQYDSEKLLAICDTDLLGKRFEHNGLKMSVLPRFYGELEYSEDEILLEMNNSTSINAMGENVCQLLLDHNYAHPDTILWIETDEQRIGHVIVVRQ